VNKRLLLVFAVFIVLTLGVLLIMNVNKGKASRFSGQPSLSSASALINTAKDLETKGDLLGAKNIYQKLVNDFSGSSQIADWQKKLEGINIRLLFSSQITPGSMAYEVKSGDTLTKIAKEFKTTVDLLKKSNNLTNDNIVPGRKIKVWAAPFSILVDKSQNTLMLKSGEEVFKSYIVSTGANNSTPVGNFKIVNKLQDPTWFKAGAVVPAGSGENILGSRWLGFDLPGYGIHGTTEPQSLGKQVTQGCVRMANSEVEELYIIVPVGTEVTIVD
jgi:lipoprotein-anchoring transpeptidase ErfK/SrfK